MTRLHRQSIFLVLTALLYLPSHATAAVQTVLNFDDVVTDGVNAVPMPPGYGGVSWAGNIGIVGYPSDVYYVPQSPPNRAFFSYHDESRVGETLVTFVGGPKIFDGAYFSGYFEIQFNLYNGASLVGTSTILSLCCIGGNGTGGPTFLPSGYAGPVDTVGIVLDRPFVVMDNFTFHEVPEPSTLLLLGIGAISLLGRRKAKSDRN